MSKKSRMYYIVKNNIKNLKLPKDICIYFHTNYWINLLLALINKMGYTYYNHIYLRNSYFIWNTKYLKKFIKHELKHVEQFYNIKFFPIKYLFELIKNGYKKNVYEVEARNYEKFKKEE